MTDNPPGTHPDLESFAPRARRPADFDSFWADVRAQTDAVPLRPELQLSVLRSSPDVHVFRVHFDSLDHVRLAGWYCLPAALPQPLPAMLLLPGYISDPPIPKKLARQGFAVLSIGPRGK